MCEWMYLHLNQPFRNEPHTFSNNYAWYWCDNIHSAKIFINFILQEEQLTSLDTRCFSTVKINKWYLTNFKYLHISNFLFPQWKRKSSTKIQEPARHYQQLVNKETLLIFYIIRNMLTFQTCKYFTSGYTAYEFVICCSNYCDWCNRFRHF